MIATVAWAEVLLPLVLVASSTWVIVLSTLSEQFEIEILGDHKHLELRLKLEQGITPLQNG